MFTYISLGTNNLPRAMLFYDAVMAALGQARCITNVDDGWVGWGRYDEINQHSELALWVCTPFNGQPASSGNGTMVALAVATRAQVRAFHAAALTHGGSSEGAPGLRLHYSPSFYAAYVRDPDGNKLAAVCHADGE